MKYKLSLLILLLISVFGSAQISMFYENRKANFSYFQTTNINLKLPESIQQFLEEQFRCSLHLVKKSGNQFTTTYTYSQYQNNIEIYQGFVKAIFDNNANEFLVISDVFKGVPELTTTIHNACWYFHKNEWVLTTKRVEINKEEITLNEIIRDPNNTIIAQKDLALRGQAKDSTIRVRVFNPDPLTSAHRTYFAPYLDYNDSDVAVLNTQRVWKNIQCKFDNDTFWLSNQYVTPLKFDPVKSYNPVFRKDTLFDYTRHQHEFEDVMVFYHITKFQEHINAMGYDTLGFRPIPCDAHAYTQDQSQYLPGLGLVFGTGGIDDAEDAEIITHEYTHSLREFASPLTNNGSERQALEEGLCDYLSTSYKMAIDSFGWRKWAYWDGNNPSQNWTGRNMASLKMYPQALTSDLWLNGEIWSSALMRIYLKLGRTTTDKLMLHTLYYLSNNLSMTQTALLFIKADTALFNGIHTDTIWNTFAETHILPWKTGINTPPICTKQDEPLKCINTLAFAEGKASLTIVLPLFEDGTYYITNSLGQEITASTFQGDNLILVPAVIKSPGVYYLSIKTPTSTKIIKLIRY